MIRLEKQRLRDEMRGILRTLLPSDRESLSARIVAALRAWPLWQSAASLSAFAALPGEPDILSPWPDGKLLSLPRVEAGSIAMHLVRSPYELDPGKFGILEPSIQAPASEGPWDLILVPGLAFDRCGGRLGRGRGYYDRFLAQHPETVRVGICFDEQVVQELPLEPHDLRLNALVTPSGILHFAG